MKWIETYLNPILNMTVIDDAQSFVPITSTIQVIDALT